jgi:peptidylprolyl isomerase
VPTNQQRRDNERRRLQRQLEERRAREIARRRMTLIGSIIGTLVIIAAVVVIVVLSTGGHKKNDAAGHDTITSPPTTTSSTAAAPAVNPPTAPCAGPGKGATASYKGVGVTGATNLKAGPKVTSKGTGDPATVQCQDLVVGTGKAAGPASSVTVQYTGVLYKDGTAFDSSWTKGQPAKFSLTGVIPGFTQGIGGAGKVAPMKVGGRRLMILPSALGYGAQGSGAIPPNAPLVFIVDLVSVDG